MAEPCSNRGGPVARRQVAELTLSCSNSLALLFGKRVLDGPTQLLLDSVGTRNLHLPTYSHSLTNCDAAFLRMSTRDAIADVEAKPPSRDPVAYASKTTSWRANAGTAATEFPLWVR